MHTRAELDELSSYVVAVVASVMAVPFLTALLAMHLVHSGALHL